MTMTTPASGAQQQPTVQTADINYAAFLKLSRVPFVRTVRDGGRLLFVFEKVEGYSDLQRCWFNRTAKGVLPDYADELRALKSLIHMDMDR